MYMGMCVGLITPLDLLHHETAPRANKGSGSMSAGTC